MTAEQSGTACRRYKRSRLTTDRRYSTTNDFDRHHMRNKYTQYVSSHGIFLFLDSKGPS